MNERTQKHISKLLSLVLRHQPEAIGVSLDAGGWVAVDVLLARLDAHGHRLTPAGLAQLVAANDKQRFALSPDGARIRAVQGHSVPADLALHPADPPPVLYHGTVAAALPAIRAEGLRPMQRQYVHLSADPETARTVARRRGAPVLLVVDVPALQQAGTSFYQAENGVWLTAAVPPAYLRFPE